MRASVRIAAFAAALAVLPPSPHAQQIFNKSIAH